MSQPRTGTDPALILEHAPYVRALARRLVFDRHLAQDVQQDVLLSALENSPRDPRALKSWLAAVVRNLASKSRRSRHRARARETIAARREEGVPTPAEILAREDTRRWLIEHVVSLDEPVRAVIILRFLEELSPAEVARRLGVPLETVRTRIKRGLEELRGRLDRDTRDGTAAWCVALVTNLRLEPPSLVAHLTGVLAMSVAKKSTLAIVALVLLSTLVFVRRSVAPYAPPSEAANAHPSLETPPSMELAVNVPDADARSSRAPEPAAAAASPTTGSLVVHVEWSDDKTPAAGVLVSLYRIGADPLFEEPSATSDEHGTIRFTGLPPGGVYLQAHRGDSSSGNAIPIVAGKEADTTLALDVGMNCKGLVVDDRERPIPGAEVLVAGWAGGEALPLTRAAADGTFSLRSVSTHAHIGARAPGYAASKLRQFTAGKGAETELRIVLDERAVELTGVVLDPRRQAVEGAVVQAGREDLGVQKLSDGGLAKAPMPARMRTDAQGRFAFESLAPGSVPLAVRARGLAPWHQTIELERGRSNALTVQLEAGVTLAGTVRDATGVVIPKASIEVGAREDLSFRNAVSDANGAYRIEGLASGEWTVHAERDQQGKAESTLQAVAGQTLRWDPVLSKGLELHGLVVDADGKPVKGATVDAILEPATDEDPWYGSEGTDAEGRFSLKNCAAGRALRIDVTRKSLFPEVRVEHVVPSAEPLVIRLPKEAWVHIRGTVLDPDGKPLASVQVSPCMKGANSAPAESADAKTGSFHCGPYPPGDYELGLQSAGYPRIHVPLHTVGPDEVWDVGTLKFERGGSLLVNVSAPSGEPKPPHRWFQIVDAHGAFVETLDVIDGTGRAGPLAAGSYFLKISGEGIATRLEPVEVRVGVELTVDIALR